MPPSSSSKRPIDADDDDNDNNNHHLQPDAKVARVDGIPTSSTPSPAAQRKKSVASSRTGQACDRCKIRKIRCDARPGGCSPCLQNNTQCKTTDRITGRATSRGHTENLENENGFLRMYTLELKAQLRQHGIAPKTMSSIPPSRNSDSNGTASYWPGQAGYQSATNAYAAAAPVAPQSAATERQVSQASLLSDFRPGCVGDNYLGVSSENNWLSAIQGTSLALFGTKIDLAEFMTPESDPAAVAMSYSTFLKYAFGKAPPYVPPLPAYEQCKVYADWYFRSVQQFIPVLHKPDFMRLLDRIHHEAYQPSAAETVMVHMVLSVLNWQFSARNANEQARQDSMSHYHYSLSFVADLITSHQLEDIQALVMICSQLRNAARPGAAWMFTNTVMGLAIESGLHRSAKAWQGSAMNQDPHHIEMRKRVFWTLLLFHVHVSGKLGRPMPIRFEDFDIEMPEFLADNLPDEAVAGKWKSCSWRASISGFKLLKIMMHVYSTIYSIKSTGQYDANVRALETELDEFYSSIPVELNGGPHTTEEDRVSATYLELSVAGCQLLLHHPSLCRSASQEMMSNNLDICLHWCSKLLSCAMQLKDLRSLDTTWYYSTDFIAAIFTTLFISNERRSHMTSTELQRLRQEMDQWLDVMGEVGDLLGTGQKLRIAIQNIIDCSLENITRTIAARTASAAVASAASSPPAQEQAYENANAANNYYSNGTSSGDATHGQSYANTARQDQAEGSYPPHRQFPYQENVSSSLPAYNSTSNLEVQLVTHNASMSAAPQTPAPTNFMTTFQSSNPASNGFQHVSPESYLHSGPMAWRQFADTMVTNVGGGQDYINSAGALMALSGKAGEGSMNMAAATSGDLQVSPEHVWPLMHYGNGQQQ